MQKQQRKKRNIKRKPIKYRLKSFFHRRIRRKKIKRTFDGYKIVVTKNYAQFAIIVKPNNIFCFVKHNADPKFTKTYSTGGVFNLKTTKKRIKSNIFPVINKFFVLSKKRYLSLITQSRLIVFSIVAPYKMKKKIVRHLKKTFFKRLFRKKRVLLTIKSLKVFNGCRVRKQRRKKRKGFRVLK